MKKADNMNFSKLAWGTLAIVAGGALSWGGWVTISLADRPNEAEVYRIVETAAPYTRDKAAIEARLEHVKEVEGRLADVIEKNTDAINSLRVEITKSRD